MNKTSSEADIENFGNTSIHDTDVASKTPSNEPPHILDADRHALYTVLAGLLEANIDFPTAVHLYTMEARARNKPQMADRITAFLETVLDLRKIKQDSNTPPWNAMSKSADLCFGKGFVTADEMVLLRGLTYSDTLAPIFRAAAQIVQNNIIRAGTAGPIVAKSRRP